MKKSVCDKKNEMFECKDFIANIFTNHMHYAHNGFFNNNIDIH